MYVHTFLLSLQLLLLLPSHCVFVIRLLFRVYFCLFMFCFLYSLQLPFPSCFVCALRSLSHSVSLACKLLRACQSSLAGSGALALSLSLVLSQTCPLCAHYCNRQQERTVFTFIVQLIRLLSPPHPLLHILHRLHATCTPRHALGRFHFASLRSRSRARARLCTALLGSVSAPPLLRLCSALHRLCSLCAC